MTPVPPARRLAARARPVLLLAVLIPLHLGGQLLVLGRVVPALLALPLVAVAAFEAADRAAQRHAERRRAAVVAAGGAG